jgi:hypothetical protein
MGKAGQRVREATIRQDRRVQAAGEVTQLCETGS